MLQPSVVEQGIAAVRNWYDGHWRFLCKVLQAAVLINKMAFPSKHGNSPEM